MPNTSSNLRDGGARVLEVSITSAAEERSSASLPGATGQLLAGAVLPGAGAVRWTKRPTAAQPAQKSAQLARSW